MGKTYYDAYAISQDTSGDGKKRWIRIGAAFVNADDSINVVLHCNPLDGKIQLRLPERKKA